jgi:hypothetical protein
MLETNRIVAMPDTEFGAEVGILQGLGRGGGGGGGWHGGGGHHHGGGSSIFIGGGWGGWGGWYPPGPCDPILDPYCEYPYPYAVAVPVAVPVLSGMEENLDRASSVFHTILAVSILALIYKGMKKK